METCLHMEKNAVSSQLTYGNPLEFPNKSHSQWKRNSEVVFPSSAQQLWASMEVSHSNTETQKNTSSHTGNLHKSWCDVLGTQACARTFFKSL